MSTPFAFFLTIIRKKAKGVDTTKEILKKRIKVKEKLLYIHNQRATSSRTRRPNSGPYKEIDVDDSINKEDELGS